MRPSWVEVDVGAVAHNVAAFARLVAPAELCTVVKADGYGHGDVPIAETALSSGATWLAVALVEEGVRLREAGIEAPILVLSEPTGDDAAEFRAWQLTPTVYRHSFLDRLASGIGPVSVHLKLDTGMHRVGTDAETVVSLARRISNDEPSFRLGGLWTHFAVAEEDPEFTETQIEAFDEVVARLEGEGIEVGIQHLANTPGAILHPRSRRHLVRIGLGTYGLYPSPECREMIDLRPAMRVVSHVSYVRRLPAGSRPSYGRRRALEHDSKVVTVPIGYADGVPRVLSQRRGEVLIGGRRYPFAGTITMDQVVVDVGDDEVEVGDEVVLMGRQGRAEISADEWAAKLETINYEVVCLPASRLPRRYVP